MTPFEHPLHRTRWVVRILFAASAIAAALAIHAALHPAVPFGRGFSGLVLAVLAKGVGPYANAVMWGVMSIIALVTGRWVWRRAPRVPSDRWWG